MKEKARAGSEGRDGFLVAALAVALVVVVSGRSLMAVTEREGVRVVGVVEVNYERLARVVTGRLTA
jgi:hypothetical protein